MNILVAITALSPVRSDFLQVVVPQMLEDILGWDLFDLKLLEEDRLFDYLIRVRLSVHKLFVNRSLDECWLDLTTRAALSINVKEPLKLRIDDK